MGLTWKCPTSHCPDNGYYTVTLGHRIPIQYGIIMIGFLDIPLGMSVHWGDMRECSL